MRFLISVLFLTFVYSCGGTKIPTDVKVITPKLDGTWIPVKQEMGGATLPVSIYENQKLILSGDKYTLISETIDQGILTFNGRKIDIYGKEGPNAGKHIKAIFDYENELLIICYNLSGDSYPEQFETIGKPNYFLSVFKKI